MKFLSRSYLAVIAALGISIPLAAQATNGMFMIGYGAKATAMGGAGTAYPQDSMAAAYNPASMPEVKQGRFDATLELFYPPRSVTHDGGAPLGDTDARSKNDLFPIPAIGMVMADPDEDLAFGFAMIGAGLGTSYPQQDQSFFDPVGTTPALTGYDRVGVFLMQMQMLPSVAWKVSENQNIGASLVIAMQTFRAFGLEAFAGLGYTNDSSAFTNRNSDWSTGFGARLGWFGKFFDQNLNVGVLYAPKVKMQKFEKYSGLFANEGEFDIPENYTLGLAFKATPSMDIAFDVERINWAKVPSIGNPGPLANDPNTFFPLCPTGTDTTPCKLGGEKGLGFGWTNQTVYKLGVAYKWDKDLTLRAGVNYGKAPIPSDQVLFNMLAPATTEKHITFGATYITQKRSDITFTFMHAFENTIRGPTAFPPTPGTIVDGSNAALTMSQTSLSIAYGSKF